MKSFVEVSGSWMKARVWLLFEQGGKQWHSISVFEQLSLKIEQRAGGSASLWACPPGMATGRGGQAVGVLHW